MKIDEIGRIEQPRVYSYLTKRYMQAEARITQLTPPAESLDIHVPDPVYLTHEAIAAMESLKAAEADREAWRGGAIRDDLYGRWLAIDAGQLIQLPDSPVELEFVTALDRTGMRTSFLWRAREGDRLRGVILSSTDQLRATLQPHAEDAELREAVLQVALPKLHAELHDVDAFFAATDDVEIILHVNEVDPNWKRGRRFPTL